MSIIKAAICSNCGKSVPDSCDGKTYSVPDWKRLVCRGMDGESFVPSVTNKPLFRIVVGHGNSYDVPLTER